ncbi:glycosyltransferase family protein [Apibacter adventoris]|uniref:Glycosyl transferase family 1 domain-containing protein n=1 Tax=Apibacter adventoris TaxID=1679466 RepID=A0A2S8AGI8_9FLAO|nr:hypothetical protein [Apibacter adventoris]PQL95490.1 hypothetical protein C4S77_01465 [Apibacter adventoris]
MIVFVDRIGEHSGMHNYIEAFIYQFEKRKYKTSVISNYPEGNSILKNYYKGSLFRRLFCFVYSYLLYIYNLIKNRKNYFIISFYGEIQDVLFIFPFLLFKKNKVIIDVHEVVGLDINNRILRRIIYFLINYVAGTAIYHSKRIREKLDEVEYKGDVIYCPHLKYLYSKEYDIKNIKNEIINLIDNRKVNFLFFGNIRDSKGIDLLFEVLSKLDKKYIQESNFIIAGKDPDDLLSRFPKMGNVKLLTRHITDEESNFLYSKTNYVLLPYNEISQSGVLETAIYFKKLSICSNLEYFQNIIFNFKSFGFIFNSSEEFIKIIQKLCVESIYTIKENDYNQYMQDDAVDTFFHQISKKIKNEISNNYYL